MEIRSRANFCSPCGGIDSGTPSNFTLLSRERSSRSANFAFTYRASSLEFSYESTKSLIMVVNFVFFFPHLLYICREFVDEGG